MISRHCFDEWKIRIVPARASRICSFRRRTKRPFFNRFPVIIPFNQRFIMTAYCVKTKARGVFCFFFRTPGQPQAAARACNVRVAVARRAGARRPSTVIYSEISVWFTSGKRQAESVKRGLPVGGWRDCAAT